MSSATGNRRNGPAPGGLSLREAAERVGVATSTLRRWARDGLIPRYDGSWSVASVSHAKIVARLRERGHSLREIRQASDQGRLAFGYVEELFDTREEAFTLAQASRETGLEPALIERVVAALGTTQAQVDHLSASDVQLLRVVAKVLESGLPLVAMLQLVRVDLGRMRVAIAFADLAGYTRLTEEAGEIEAVDVVERFVDAVEGSLSEDARVIKTIGDEAMIVGSDPAALSEWAVAFQRLERGRTLPRIAIHYGNALYRDGDYYGRDVNIASRVAARAAGGEVLVTRPPAPNRPRPPR